MRGSDRDISYIYDSENNLIQISDISQNMKIKFVYDKNNREILRYYGSGESIRTQYDKAGHVTLKILYSSQNIPIAMEGNVYDADGARILCVSLEGCVTKFSYDSDGRISSVQYPYSDSISLYFKKKCAESGLLLKDSASLLHTISITSEQRTALENVCRQIGPSFVSILKLDHPLIEVSYSYDENSNCTAMETPWGTIQYKYDDDDRMVSFGKSGVCAYDNNGNLINENNLYNSKEYTYNNNNRMITAIARNLITQTQTQTVYVYDVFGRRIETEQTGIASRRTSYDGFTFEELTSEPISQAYLGNQENQSRTARSAENINAADNRYAWIYGEDTNMSKRSDETLWNGKNAALYDNDGRASFLHSSASTNTVESRAVLFSNVVGSVCASVRDDGIVSYASYDIFGAAVENTFDKNQTFGYAGKQIDNITGLYNYGFRDYQADTARFTTNDPIRDGTNWYTYCGCDPVNYVDLWGLEIVDLENQEMQNFWYTVEPLGNATVQYNSTGEIVGGTIGTEGCLVTGIAEIISALTGMNVNAYTINENKSNFLENSGILNTAAVAVAYGLSCDYWTAAKQGDLSTIINNLAASNTAYGVLAQVLCSSASTCTHFVGITGSTVIINGVPYVQISTTSKYDKELNDQRKNIGWVSKSGKTFIPTSVIVKIENFKNK